MNGTTTGARQKRRINPASFMKPVQPDDTLSVITGGNPVSRSELIKRLWEYIRKHGLQDKQRKALINADDNLRAVFGGKSQVTMFEMTELVSTHLIS